MTRVEQRAIIKAVPAASDFKWLGDVDPKFVQLVTHPCPLLTADGSCSVYDVRPYNCRRFVCLRESQESWVTGKHGECVNADRRIQSMPQAAAFYRSNQALAQGWARQHGWTEHMR